MLRFLACLLVADWLPHVIIEIMIFIIIIINIIVVSSSYPATNADSSLVASCHDTTSRCCNVQML